MRRKLEAFFYAHERPARRIGEKSVPCSIGRARREGKKADALHYAYLAFLACFVAGILVTNILQQKDVGVRGWSGYWLENLRYQEIDGTELFYFILRERMPISFLFLLMAFTNLAMAFGAIYIGWQGFCAGTLMSSAVIAYGIKGIFLVLAGMFPHYLCYFFAYFAYLWLMRQRKNIQAAAQAGSRRWMAFTLSGALLFFVFVTGIFLESYANPYFLKICLKFI